MIDNVHAPAGARTGWPVERALGERRVRGVVGGFEEVGELVEDVRDRGSGARVEEGDEARAGCDELLERGPGGDGEGGGCCWRGVGVWFEPAGGVGGVEGADGDVVAVDEQDGDDFVGVGVEP